jgi:ABC-type sugar transport system substrate-binding protein
VIDRRYALNVAYGEQGFFNEVRGTGRKIGSVVPGVEFVFGGPNDADSDRQINELHALIARKVNGIILFPADANALAPTVNKAVTSGIPVVTLFSDVKDSNRLTLVGAPEEESARRLAEGVLKEVASNLMTPRECKKIKVLVSYNKPGETVTDARLAGIKQVIEAREYRRRIELVGVVSDSGDARRALEAIAPVLEEHKDLKVIFGLNARSAIGAIAALKEVRKENGEAYKPGDVLLTSWDSEEDVLRAIDEGWIHSTSVLNSSLCTLVCFGILEAHNQGYLYPEGLQLRELSFPAVPPEILIPETLVDKHNVAGYRRGK